MKHYAVKITKQAKDQVFDYAEYIQNKLMNPQASRKLINDMRTAVKSLSQMPQRNPLTDEEPWRSMGVRKMVVRGYIVYYWIDEANGVAHVICVVYEKREQSKQLEIIDFNE